MTRSYYTIAADLIRGIAGYGDKGTKLSRADASQIIHAIADAINMHPDELAKKVAEYARSCESEGGHPIVKMNENEFFMRFER